MPSSLMLGSINAFAILGQGIVWMIAGLIAGVLVGIPFYFIALSSKNSSTETATKATMFVVASITLAGLLIGGYQEFDKQHRSIINNERRENVPTLTSPQL
ncbi:hypothetical protein ACE1CD_32865 [Aerosakkonema sp. BLCC-F183]|uniref:hypothetical protein n=1 Tax=Aerosakkonema sp. BLCC-F183 TaxID=3342834 RepID=UPI0035B88B84